MIACQCTVAGALYSDVLRTSEDGSEHSASIPSPPDLQLDTLVSRHIFRDLQHDLSRVQSYPTKLPTSAVTPQKLELRRRLVQQHTKPPPKLRSRPANPTAADSRRPQDKGGGVVSEHGSKARGVNKRDKAIDSPPSPPQHVRPGRADGPLKGAGDGDVFASVVKRLRLVEKENAELKTRLADKEKDLAAMCERERFREDMFDGSVATDANVERDDGGAVRLAYKYLEEKKQLKNELAIMRKYLASYGVTWNEGGRDTDLRAADELSIASLGYQGEFDAERALQDLKQTEREGRDQRFRPPSLLDKGHPVQRHRRLHLNRCVSNPPENSDTPAPAAPFPPPLSARGPREKPHAPPSYMGGKRWYPPRHIGPLQPLDNEGAAAAGVSDVLLSPIHEERSSAHEHALVDFNRIQRAVAELNLMAGEDEPADAADDREESDLFVQSYGIMRLRHSPKPAAAGPSLPLIFYSNGLHLDPLHRPFYPYSHPQSQQILRDILEGYFPSVLQQTYPEGVALAPIDKTLTEYRPDASAVTANLRDTAGSRVCYGDQWRRFPEVAPLIERQQQPHIDQGLRRVTNKSNKDQFLQRLPKRVIRGGVIVEVRSEIARQLDHQPLPNILHHTPRQGSQQQRREQCARAADARIGSGAVAPDTDSERQRRLRIQKEPRRTPAHHGLRNGVRLRVQCRGWDEIPPTTAPLEIEYDSASWSRATIEELISAVLDNRCDWVRQGSSACDLVFPSVRPPHVVSRITLARDAGGDTSTVASGQWKLLSSILQDARGSYAVYFSLF
ncbi:unnamed protein product [Vitrella brassicaformis CCMP3155]|uniref:SEP domain-containing protein n=3 Tax=Vitrella brassicaformis TaxID=1169539 RepID=A0A0G4GH10_VITBC|nr:unnamed protein product [Vitrella brassicaformis CCMP3155]|eukprot:CEM28750.1 unnamed protein product [Vitrella brassicaformis CCMP3155]